jgi:hypothetical protein
MKKYALVLLVATVPMLPVGLMACDCGCDDHLAPIHFTDGIAPNGPVTGDAASADPSHYGHGCGCDIFGFRDYGPARAVVPPPAPEAKDMKPSS